MTRLGILKDILQYIVTPEDTTESGCRDILTANSRLFDKQAWLAPLKAAVWLVTAVVGPVLLLILLA